MLFWTESGKKEGKYDIEKETRESSIHSSNQNYNVPKCLRIVTINAEQKPSTFLGYVRSDMNEQAYSIYCPKK